MLARLGRLRRMAIWAVGILASLHCIRMSRSQARPLYVGNQQQQTALGGYEG